MNDPWLFDRCREIQASPNGYLDLWAREHYKSTIITFGKTIQDILASHGDDPLPEWEGIEATIGIFSHSRPIAKDFLTQIKFEFETNRLLKEWFPDILWQDPKRHSPSWSEDGGIIVKRSSNPKEATVEAWGLVDGQPTGKHFYIQVYDDVVTLESVRSSGMMKKTLEAWEHSLNLGAQGGHQRYIGTRYHFNDAYKDILKREAAIPRLYPGTEDGSPEGDPVLWSRDLMALKRRRMGSYTFACQILQNPVADDVQGFVEENLRFYERISREGMNVYILVDPASEKKKSSDYTVFIVVGFNDDENIYVLDIVRDRLNLTERTNMLFDLHRKWRPMRNGVGYEKYGKDADIEHIEAEQERRNYRFPITPLGGPLAKEDRIRRLVPHFEAQRIYLPEKKIRKDYQGVPRDLVRDFIDEELVPFPVGEHDDMLDALARIEDADMNTQFPKPDEAYIDDDEDDGLSGEHSWMGA